MQSTEGFFIFKKRKVYHSTQLTMRFPHTILVLNAFPGISEDFNLKVFAGEHAPEQP